MATDRPMAVESPRCPLGHQLLTSPVRITEFAPAFSPPPPYTAPSSGYAPPQVGSTWKTGRFSGQDFRLQPDGTLRCPAEQTLLSHEQRREADGSLRVVYCASIRSCRPCPLRERWRVRMAVTPRNRARPACSCIRLWSGKRRFGFAGLESAGASPGLHPASAPSTGDGPGGGEADLTRHQVHAAFPR